MVNSANPKCPLCRAALVAAQLRAGVTAAEAAAAAAAAAGDQGVEEAMEVEGSDQQAVAVSESKLQALLKEVIRMRSSAEGGLGGCVVVQQVG